MFVVCQRHHRPLIREQCVHPLQPRELSRREQLEPGLLFAVRVRQVCRSKRIDRVQNMRVRILFS